MIARRAPGRHEELSWVYEFDEGIDPDDPEVRRIAAEALVAAREELGACLTDLDFERSGPLANLSRCIDPL